MLSFIKYRKFSLPSRVLTVLLIHIICTIEERSCILGLNDSNLFVDNCNRHIAMAILRISDRRCVSWLAYDCRSSQSKQEEMSYDYISSCSDWLLRQGLSAISVSQQFCGGNFRKTVRFLFLRMKATFEPRSNSYLTINSSTEKLKGNAQTTNNI